MIFFVILLLIFILIINIIISNSKNENFGADPNKLIYLNDIDAVCAGCKDFNPLWTNIENEVKNNYLYYNFITTKYNIDTDKDGKAIATAGKINTPPAIVFKRNDKYTTYSNKSKDINVILEWARNLGS